VKASLDCLECIAKQTLRAARCASDDPAVHREALNRVARAIPEMDLDISPAVLSRIAYEASRDVSGNPDPYYEHKREQNALALELEPEMREILDQSDNRLMAALHLAAAGNVIDLGTMQAHEIDVQRVVREVMAEGFAVDHTGHLLRSLEQCNDLLYLLDNAGEIVFDKLLIEELLKHTPVTAVVKAAPIINDALLEDAEQVGLTEVCQVIDNGGAFIGSPVDEVPTHFLARMHAADVIIGKGQGNFETIDVFDGDVYMILRAKCEVVAAHMGVKYGQVGLIGTRARAGGWMSPSAG
jgi:uncharacterized protein with ATP-grasp and redox domains